MKNIVKIFIKNREVFKNVIIVFIIAVCGVIYCIYGRKLIKNNYDSDENTINNGWDIAESGESFGSDDVGEELESFRNQIADNYVYICGCVLNPGVYTCPEGTRLYELIDMAGGFTDSADKDYLNLVEIVIDGQKVYVPKEGEVVGQGTYGELKVNINTADKDMLMTLPGIGEARAADIVAYRETHGRFSKVEDIMNVSGIKEAAYEKIKDYIIV